VLCTIQAGFNTRESKMKKSALTVSKMDYSIQSMESAIVASVRVSYALEGHAYSKEDWEQMGKFSKLMNKSSAFKDNYKGLLAAI
jgi:hypothetical protein